MRVLTRLFVLAIFSLAISACSWRTKSELIDTGTVDQGYAICKSAIDNGNYERAVRDLKRLTGRFPFGEIAEQAQLDLAFAQSKLGDSDEATATITRFIKTYPTHKHVDYAYYLKALINGERNVGMIDRLVPRDRPRHDQSTNKQAYLDFSDFLKRFPDSEYAGDARARMIAVRTILAESELEVAQYYLRRGANVGAINRAKNVLENYQNTPQAFDALAVMIVGYKALKEDKLADDAEKVLRLNAPEHAYFTGASKSGWWIFGR
jgi:outer membrane protein assembly factor BamD